MIIDLIISIGFAVLFCIFVFVIFPQVGEMIEQMFERGIEKLIDEPEKAKSKEGK